MPAQEHLVSGESVTSAEAAVTQASDDDSAAMMAKLSEEEQRELAACLAKIGQLELQHQEDSVLVSGETLDEGTIDRHASTIDLHGPNFCKLFRM